MFLLFLFFAQPELLALPNGLWHAAERKVHYCADGEDFIIVKSKHRINLALYGFTSRAVDGNTGTVLDMPLDPSKK